MKDKLKKNIKSLEGIIRKLIFANLKIFGPYDDVTFVQLKFGPHIFM